MTTTFSFSDSVATAFDFSHKLLAGTLNFRRGYDSDFINLVEVHHEDEFFSTRAIRNLRVQLGRNSITRLEIGDSEEDPDSLCAESERREVRLYAKESGWGERHVSTFYVSRDYLDGENAEGWTRWQVKNATVHLGRARVILNRHVRHQDEAAIWGVRP